MYDAIVLDVLLPGEIDGRGVFERIRAERDGIEKRVMFITADTMNAGTRRFLERAGRPYLEKPFILSEFLGAVEKLSRESTKRGKARQKK